MYEPVKPVLVAVFEDATSENVAVLDTVMMPLEETDTVSRFTVAAATSYASRAKRLATLSRTRGVTVTPCAVMVPVQPEETGASAP